MPDSDHIEAPVESVSTARGGHVEMVIRVRTEDVLDVLRNTPEDSRRYASMVIHVRRKDP